MLSFCISACVQMAAALLLPNRSEAQQLATKAATTAALDVHAAIITMWELLYQAPPYVKWVDDPAVLRAAAAAASTTAAVAQATAASAAAPSPRDEDDDGVWRVIAHMPPEQALDLGMHSEVYAAVSEECRVSKK